MSSTHRRYMLILLALLLITGSLSACNRNKQEATSEPIQAREGGGLAGLRSSRMSRR